MRKLVILFVCVVALGTTAACSKAKAEDPSTASETAQQGTMEERMRAFAQCMRDHGIDMPDPEIITDENGGARTKVQIGPSGGPMGNAMPAPNDEAFKKAEQECRSLLPQGGELGGGPTAEDEENMRNFSKCMRENGVENFPDPQPGGGIAISPENGVNPEDPAFKEAEKKCFELMPRPEGGQMGTTTSGTVGS